MNMDLFSYQHLPEYLQPVSEKVSRFGYVAC